MRKIVELIKNRPPGLSQIFHCFLRDNGTAACVVGAAYLAAGYTDEELYEAYREFLGAGSNAYGEWPSTYVEDVLIAAGVDPDEKVLIDGEGIPLFSALYHMNDSLRKSFDEIVEYLSNEENWYRKEEK